ncbi:MAG: hypothetical protein RI973_474 [Bacteroidota bacterium]|jgi:hypothetical protein
MVRSDTGPLRLAPPKLILNEGHFFCFCEAKSKKMAFIHYVASTPMAEKAFDTAPFISRCYTHNKSLP